MTSRLKSGVWRRSVPHGGITSRNVVLISGLCVTLGKTNSASFNQTTPMSSFSVRGADRSEKTPLDLAHFSHIYRVLIEAAWAQGIGRDQLPDLPGPLGDD